MNALPQITSIHKAFPRKALVAASIAAALLLVLFGFGHKAWARGDITFQITDAVYGTSITLAHVTLTSGQSSQTIKPDNNGNFVFPGYYYTSDGSYTVTINAYGYASYTSPTPIDINPNTPAKTLTFALTDLDTSPPVAIADPVLKKVIGTSLYGPRYNDESITQLAMAGLTSISYDNYEYSSNVMGTITNLQGLEYAVRLQDLRIRFTDIASVEPLRGLPQLSDVVLDHNRITDIAPLGTLPNLQMLEIENNAISVIPRLSGKLERLYMANNQIADVSVLRDETNLNIVQLNDNQIADMSPLANLPHLTRLELESNQIAALPVMNNPALEVLYLGFNQISSLQSLRDPNQHLSSLRSIELHGNQIVDPGPLASLPDLFSVDLSYNRIASLESWRGSAGLQWYQLQLLGNQLTDLTPIAGMTELRSLDASYNVIEKLPSFTGLSIPEIDLSHNRIADVSGFANMTPPNPWSRNKVKLSYNRIREFAALHNNPSMDSLQLDHNQIADLSFMNGREGKYRILDLSGNPVSDIAPLKDTTSIRRLYLNDTLVADLSPIATLQAAGAFADYGSLVHLDGNTLLNGPLATLLGTVSERFQVKYSDPVLYTATFTADSPAAGPIETGYEQTYASFVKVKPDNYDTFGQYKRKLVVRKDGVPADAADVRVRYGEGTVPLLDGEATLGEQLSGYEGNLPGSGVHDTFGVTFLRPGHYKVSFVLEAARDSVDINPYIIPAAQSSIEYDVWTSGDYRLSFVDTDETAALGGVVTWSAAADASQTVSYSVYYLDENNNKLTSIGTVARGGTYRLAVRPGSAAPAGAVMLGLLVAGANGSSRLGMTIPLINNTDAEAVRTQLRAALFPQPGRVSIGTILGMLPQARDITGDGVFDRQDIRWLLQTIDPITMRLPA